MPRSSKKPLSFLNAWEDARKALSHMLPTIQSIVDINTDEKNNIDYIADLFFKKDNSANSDFKNMSYDIRKHILLAKFDTVTQAYDTAYEAYKNKLNEESTSTESAVFLAQVNFIDALKKRLILVLESPDSKQDSFFNSQCWTDSTRIINTHILSDESLLDDNDKIDISSKNQISQTTHNLENDFENQRHENKKTSIKIRKSHSEHLIYKKYFPLFSIIIASLTMAYQSGRENEWVWNWHKVRPTPTALYSIAGILALVAIAAFVYNRMINPIEGWIENRRHKTATQELKNNWAKLENQKNEYSKESGFIEPNASTNKNENNNQQLN